MAEQGLALRMAPSGRPVPRHRGAGAGAGGALGGCASGVARRPGVAPPGGGLVSGEAEALARLGRHAERAGAFARGRATPAPCCIARGCGRLWTRAAPLTRCRRSRRTWPGRSGRARAVARARVHASQGDRGRSTPTRAALAEISALERGAGGPRSAIDGVRRVGFRAFGKPKSPGPPGEARAPRVPGGWLSEFEALIAPGSP